MLTRQYCNLENILATLLLRSEELDMKRKLKELDDFGDLNLDNNSEVL